MFCNAHALQSLSAGDLSPHNLFFTSLVLSIEILIPAVAAPFSPVHCPITFSKSFITLKIVFNMCRSAGSKLTTLALQIFFVCASFRLLTFHICSSHY